MPLKAAQPPSTPRRAHPPQRRRWTHIKPREAAAIVYYRHRLHLSVSHISIIVERSTRTVTRLLSKNRWLHKQWDKRRWPDLMKRRGERLFQGTLAILSWFYSVWVMGDISNIDLLSGKTAEGEPP